MGEGFFSDPWAWTDSGQIFPAAAAQRTYQNQLGGLYGGLQRNLAGAEYQLSDIPYQYGAAMNDLIGSLEERGVGTGGTAIGSMAGLAHNFMGQYAQPLLGIGTALGNYGLGTTGAAQNYGDALIQALLGSASGRANKFLEMI